MLQRRETNIPWGGESAVIVEQVSGSRRPDFLLSLTLEDKVSLIKQSVQQAETQPPAFPALLQ